MYWGIVLVTALAFSCATEFVPEINTQLKLVPFTTEFKTTMTSVMVLDYVGCYAIEKVLKMLFSDFKPKDIAVRRAGPGYAGESEVAGGEGAGGEGEGGEDGEGVRVVDACVNACGCALSSWVS